jgi:hypothetical protein
MKMQCNRIGRAHAYSRMLLSLMRDRMLRERRRQSGRLKVRRRWSDDPTMPIGSAQDAMDIAEAMLESVPRQQEYERLWKGIAARPLAGLLYAGSVQGNARGIEWVRHALVNIDADASVPGWRHAAEICQEAAARHPAAGFFADGLLRVRALTPPQRASVSHMMSAAISPWRLVGTGVGGR